MKRLAISFWRLAFALLLITCLAATGFRSLAQRSVSAATDLPVQELGSIAPLPPMGWASWNHFFCDYDEKTIRAEADALVSSGMRDAGYKYVAIQECIVRERDASGNLIADSVRFPSGMPALIAYVH